MSKYVKAFYVISKIKINRCCYLFFSTSTSSSSSSFHSKQNDVSESGRDWRTTAEHHCHLDRLAMSRGRERAREGERAVVRGRAGSGRCDENRGMLLIMEKYPWLRGGKRGSQGWPAPPHLRSMVPSRCHGYCTPCILSVCHPLCRVLRSPQHSPLSHPSPLPPSFSLHYTDA